MFLENNRKNRKERGAALAVSLIVVAILSIIALTALAFSSTEARIAGSDLQRTQTFYAAEASMEKMTNDFSNLFRRKISPTAADLYTISHTYSTPLQAEGFDFFQTLDEDMVRLNEMRATQGLPNNIYPRINIAEGPYAGLYASIIPYKMTSTAKREITRTEVKLEREFNNYLVPLFQFGMFSNEDIEIHPGPLMTFNGRIHTNQNIYALRNTKFLNRITAAGEFVRDATRGGEANMSSGNNNVWVEVGGYNVQSELTKGSVMSGSGTVGGPNFTASSIGFRGFFPARPTALLIRFGMQFGSSGKRQSESFRRTSYDEYDGRNDFKIPLELAGNSPAELIKRSLPSDSELLASSRFHTKSEIRILLDDETAGSGAGNVAGIPAGKGVLLSQFMPTALNGGNVLKLIDNGGTISGAAIKQANPVDATLQDTSFVRTLKKVVPSVNTNYIPPGSGVEGRILIEIVKPDGTAVDVTQTILSMGVTEGEPLV